MLAVLVADDAAIEWLAVASAVVPSVWATDQSR